MGEIILGALEPKKMSSQKEGIAMGNRRASSADSMLWWMFSGGTNHDPQESGAGRWRTTTRQAPGSPNRTPDWQVRQAVPLAP